MKTYKINHVTKIRISQKFFLGVSRNAIISTKLNSRHEVEILAQSKHNETPITYNIDIDDLLGIHLKRDGEILASRHVTDFI